MTIIQGRMTRLWCEEERGGYMAAGHGKRCEDFIPSAVKDMSGIP
jgi:hypothetical protein